MHALNALEVSKTNEMKFVDLATIFNRPPTGLHRLHANRPVPMVIGKRIHLVTSWTKLVHVTHETPLRLALHELDLT